jgi:hypothetical protein
MNRTMWPKNHRTSNFTAVFGRWTKKQLSGSGAAEDFFWDVGTLVPALSASLWVGIWGQFTYLPNALVQASGRLEGASQTRMIGL